MRTRKAVESAARTWARGGRRRRRRLIDNPRASKSLSDWRDRMEQIVMRAHEKSVDRSFRACIRSRAASTHWQLHNAFKQIGTNSSALSLSLAARARARASWTVHRRSLLCAECIFKPGPAINIGQRARKCPRAKPPVFFKIFMRVYTACLRL